MKLRACRSEMSANQTSLENARLRRRLETYKSYSYDRAEANLQTYLAYRKDSGDITKAEDSEDNIIRAAREG
jgi:hypothetical protein